jgi:hypothetical protein
MMAALVTQLGGELADAVPPRHPCRNGRVAPRRNSWRRGGTWMKKKAKTKARKWGNLRAWAQVTPPAPPETFWALTATDWTAVTALATGALVVATLILAWVAYVQLAAAREEARAAHEETRDTRTLAVCDRYDLDPALDTACRRLRRAYDNGDLKRYPERYQFDLHSLFNYLESVAIGIDRALYNDDIVRDMMEPIFRGYVEEYILSGLAGWVDPTDGGEEYYHRLRNLCRRWAASPLTQEQPMSGRPKI